MDRENENRKGLCYCPWELKRIWVDVITATCARCSHPLGRKAVEKALKAGIIQLAAVTPPATPQWATRS